MSTNAMQTIKHLMWQINNENGSWIIEKLGPLFKSFILDNKNTLRFSTSWTSSQLKLGFSLTKMDVSKMVLIEKLTIVYTTVYFKSLPDRYPLLIWFTISIHFKETCDNIFSKYTQLMAQGETKIIYEYSYILIHLIEAQ